VGDTAGRTWWRAADAERGPAVFVIAEIGVNHDGEVERAVALVEAAATAGADAVKLQRFVPERLLSNQAQLAGYQAGVAGDAAALLRPLSLGLGAMRQVGEAARAMGLKFVVTPFSLADVPELGGLGVDAVKIASPDCVNTPLLEAAAGLGVPMLVSTGTCEPPEVEPAAAVLSGHAAGVALLQCVSSYPTAAEDAALGGIAAIRERFGLPVGYSDHTACEQTGGLAVAAGAVVLEKHLTYDRSAKGPDHAASLEPDGLKRYVDAARGAAVMLGAKAKRRLAVEGDVAAVSRQSVCAARDLPAGHELAAEDLTVKRPGTGIPAAGLSSTAGRRLARAVAAGDLVMPGDLAP